MPPIGRPTLLIYLSTQVLSRQAPQDPKPVPPLVSNTGGEVTHIVSCRVPLSRLYISPFARFFPLFLSISRFSPLVVFPPSTRAHHCSFYSTPTLLSQLQILVHTHNHTSNLSRCPVAAPTKIPQATPVSAPSLSPTVSLSTLKLVARSGNASSSTETLSKITLYYPQS